MPALAFDRAQMLRRLESEQFDVIVIGAGITGVGVALDAASRGLRTALLERDDFGSGTSSKSSKLVHGGLRYLQQGEVRLVYEALHERQRLRHNAPHLVHVLPFLIPILTKDGLLPRKLARAFGSALWMYDLTGGMRIGKVHRRLKPEAAYAHLPTLPEGRVASAYLYYDAQTDDARLCVTVARTAAANGAVCVNGCAVTGLQKDEHGNLRGVEALADGRTISVAARCVVNATGVWADDVLALDETRRGRTIRPAKGIHLVVPWEKVRNDIAVVVPVPKDRRSLFVVPWRDGRDGPDGPFRWTYIGTTDTDYDGPLDDPRCTRDDIQYVLRAINASTTTSITEEDVLGSWAGLRPLVADPDDPAAGGVGKEGRTADLSRRHRVSVSASGVVTVVGGKLTTYRKMAQDTVDAVQRHIGVRGRCRTKRLVLQGGDGYREPSGKSASALDVHLAGRFGTEAEHVAALVASRPDLGEPLVAGLPYVRAEAVYAARSEMARSVDDVLSRRTRARLLDRAASADAADSVARLIGEELGWDGVLMAASAEAFRGAVADDIASEHGNGFAAAFEAGVDSTLHPALDIALDTTGR